MPGLLFTCSWLIGSSRIFIESKNKRIKQKTPMVTNNIRDSKESMTRRLFQIRKPHFLFSPCKLGIWQGFKLLVQHLPCINFLLQTLEQGPRGFSRWSQAGGVLQCGKQEDMVHMHEHSGTLITPFATGLCKAAILTCQARAGAPESSSNITQRTKIDSFSERAHQACSTWHINPNLLGFVHFLFI